MMIRVPILRDEVIRARNRPSHVSQTTDPIPDATAGRIDRQPKHWVQTYPTVWNDSRNMGPHPAIPDEQVVPGECSPSITQSLEQSAPERPAGKIGREFRRAAVPMLAVAVMYFTVVLSTYGFGDDYQVLLDATRSNSILLEIDAAGGRPLTGLLHEVSLGLATDVSSLRWVRLFSLVAILAATAVTAAIGRRMGMGPVSAGAMAVACSSVPGVQMLAVWAVMAPASWGLLFGLLTVLLHSIAMDFGRQVRSYWIMALACSVVSWSLYQPAALVVVPGVVATGIATTRTARGFIRHLWSAAAIVSVSLAIYLVVYGLSRAIVDSWAEDRSAATDDLVEKLRWFFTDVLMRASQPWDLTPSSRLGAVLVLILLVMVFAGGVGLPAHVRMLRTAAALLSLPAAYVSGIYVAEQWPSARSRVGLEVGIILLTGAAVIALRPRVRNGGATRFAAGVSALFAGALTIFGSWNVVSNVTQPQAIEYSAARALIGQAGIAEDSVVVVRLSSPSQALVPSVILDEHGLPSTSVPWAASAMVQLEVLAADGFLVHSIEVLGSEEPLGDYPPQTVVVDFRLLLDELS
jgi:hypothetical protein